MIPETVKYNVNMVGALNYLPKVYMFISNVLIFFNCLFKFNIEIINLYPSYKLSLKAQKATNTVLKHAYYLLWKVLKI